jgi:hypothetical protein
MAFFRVAMLSEKAKMALFYYAIVCVFLLDKIKPISFPSPDYCPTSQRASS